MFLSTLFPQSMVYIFYLDCDDWQQAFFANPGGVMFLYCTEVTGWKLMHPVILQVDFFNILPKQDLLLTLNMTIMLQLPGVDILGETDKMH